MPLSPRMESLETSAMLSPRPNLDLTIQSSEFILHPPMGTITYEREI